MSDESEIFDGEGVVKKVGSKRVGKRTYYNFTVHDDDTLYMTGTNRPDIESGDEVVFEFEDTQYGNMVDLDTLEVVGHDDSMEEEEEEKPRRRKKSSSKKKAKASRGRSAKSATRKKTGSKSSYKKSSGGGKDDYWTKRAEDDVKRQKQISLQASYNTALAILSKELDLGLVTLGTAKASAPKKLAAFDALLKEKAYALWAEFFAAMEKDPFGNSDEPDDIDDMEEDVNDEQEEDDDFDD